MKKIMLILACGFFVNSLIATMADASCTGSSPTWTTTPDETSVKACIDSAVNGDTINVTAGSETWATGKTVPVGKSLTFVGAGAGVTTLTGPANILNFGTPSGTDADGIYLNPTVVTGFTFTCTVIGISGAGWRIHHNTFTCPTFGAYGVNSRYSYKNTANKGLVDHNYFYTAFVENQEYPACNSEATCIGMTHWSRPLALGTDEAVYIEDNTFVANTQPAHPLDCNEGGRMVFRFNNVTDEYFEIHSVQGYTRACRKWEIYNNTVIQSTQSVYMPARIRGGTGLLFNNTVTGTYGSYAWGFDNVRSYEPRTPVGQCDGTEPYDTNTLANGWPCRDQIGTGGDDASWVSGYPPSQANSLVPAYIFANTVNGENLPVAVINYSDTHIIANRDFYDYTASFDGTSGVGVGEKSAMPATCTAGVAYWVTDEGYWNAKNTVLGLVQPSGALYKCTSTNFWKPYYVPFSYPHPMQSGLAAPTWP